MGLATNCTTSSEKSCSPTFQCDPKTVTRALSSFAQASRRRTSEMVCPCTPVICLESSWNGADNWSYLKRTCSHPPQRRLNLKCLVSGRCRSFLGYEKSTKLGEKIVQHRIYHYVTSSLAYYQIHLYQPQMRRYLFSEPQLQ